MRKMSPFNRGWFVAGAGTALWLGSWIAIWNPFALFVMSYPVAILGLWFLLEDANK